MDTDLRKPLAWSLIVTSVLALVCVALMLPTQPPSSRDTPRTRCDYEVGLPTWLQWTQLTQYGIGVMIVGALSALLTVPSRWPVRIIACIAAVWVLYSKIASSASATGAPASMPPAT